MQPFRTVVTHITILELDILHNLYSQVRPTIKEVYSQNVGFH